MSTSTNRVRIVLQLYSTFDTPLLDATPSARSAALSAPTLLACSGDGSYVAPFAVDVCDPVVKHFSSTLGQANWHAVLHAANVGLACVSRQWTYDKAPRRARESGPTDCGYRARAETLPSGSSGGYAGLRFLLRVVSSASLKFWVCLA